jgi:hypothetical protein
MYDGPHYIPADGEPSDLDAFPLWQCGWCGGVSFYLPRCLCGAPTPAGVGGQGILLDLDP